MLNKIIDEFLNYLRENRPHILKHPHFSDYINDFSRYMSLPMHEGRIAFWPCLDEKCAETPLDKYYFYQDTWAAKRIFDIRPKRVVDVGSTALFVGIISQLIPTVSIDVRPLSVSLHGLECQQASITSLPFEENSIELLSSMCVIEHVGLGRYGDELDTQGSVKAFKEVSRVVRLGGHLLFSVPTSHTPGLSFNAHRIFSKEHVFQLLPNFVLKEEMFLFPEPGPEENVASLKGFQYCVWCSHMIKVDGEVSQIGGEKNSVG